MFDNSLRNPIGFVIFLTKIRYGGELSDKESLLSKVFGFATAMSSTYICQTESDGGMVEKW